METRVPIKIKESIRDEIKILVAIEKDVTMGEYLERIYEEHKRRENITPKIIKHERSGSKLV